MSVDRNRVMEAAREVVVYDVLSLYRPARFLRFDSD